MGFEVYRPRGEKGEGKQPLVTLSKNSLVMNKIAREKLKADSIELAYDKTSNMIRIKAADEGGQTVKKTKVFARGFYNHFGIDKKGKFVAKYDENENALFVNLS